MMRKRLLLSAAVLWIALIGTNAWAQDFSGGAVQIKSFPLDGKHEIAPLYQTSINDKFTRSESAGVQYLWHLGEYLAFGGDFVYAFMSQETNLIEVMRQGGTIKTLEDAPVEPYRRLVQWMAGATVHVNPLYGKWSLASELNLRWDLYISLGAGVVNTALGSPIDAPEATGVTGAKVNPAGNVGLGMRFYILEWLALRFEMRDWIYQESGVVEVKDAGGPSEQRIEESKIKQLPLGTLGISFLL